MLELKVEPPHKFEPGSEGSKSTPPANFHKAFTSETPKDPEKAGALVVVPPTCVPDESLFANFEYAFV